MTQRRRPPQAAPASTPRQGNRERQRSAGPATVVVRLRRLQVRALLWLRPLPERLGRAAVGPLSTGSFERRLVSAYDALVEAEARGQRP